MDHDIFEHSGTSHIVRRWIFFFGGGGEVLGGTEGDESSPTEYQGGTIKN